MHRFLLMFMFLAVSAMANESVSSGLCYPEKNDNLQELPAIAFIASQKLCDKFQLSYERMSWQLLTIETKNVLSFDKSNTTYEFGELKNGRIWVRATSSINGAKQSGMLWFKIKGFVTAWVAKHDNSVGSFLHEDDVEQKLGDIATTNINPVEIIKDPRGLFVRKIVRKGEIISTLNASEPPLVVQNQNVKVIVKSSGLQITAKAVALSSGWHVGDKITILVNGASEKVEATVEQRGLVNVSI